MQENYVIVMSGRDNFHPQTVLLKSSSVAPPTDVLPGSIAYTADGSYTAVFDGENWVQSSSGGGGGGGGGGDTVTIVNVNLETETLDKKAGELFNLCKTGVVKLKVYGPGVEAYMTMDAVRVTNGSGTVYTFATQEMDFQATSADDYPTGGGDPDPTPMS